MAVFLLNPGRKIKLITIRRFRGVDLRTGKSGFIDVF